MLVYRIEQNGAGAYSGLLAFTNHVNPKTHPNPYNDIELCNSFKSGIHFFGFKDLDQLEAWFTMEERDEMSFYGYELKLYEVDDDYAVISKFQVIFEIKKATLLETLDPSTYTYEEKIAC